MLNISEERVHEKIFYEKYKSFQILSTKNVSKWLIILIMFVLVTIILSMFLPWTQNIRSKGYVTTLYPNERPQNIQSVIGGRIDKWYVNEGQLVNTGDTILKISEVKQDYFDPELLQRTADQVAAKQGSSNAYQEKATNLQDQIIAIEKNLKIKLEQNQIKKKQIKLKIESDSIDLVAAKIKLEIANKQLVRIQNLYEEGIKSLTDLESKKLTVQSSNSKVISLENKINSNINELENLSANENSIKKVQCLFRSNN